VIDRRTSIDELFSFIGAERIEVSKNDGESVGRFTAIIGRDDFDDNFDDESETAYLCSIPGMKEKILNGLNAPASEFSPVPREFFNAHIPAA
jgi:hypothetical protein